MIFFKHKVKVYIPCQLQNEYILIASISVSPSSPHISLCEITPYPDNIVAIRIGYKLAQMLQGKEFNVICKNGVHKFVVEYHYPFFWHEFTV